MSIFYRPLIIKKLLNSFFIYLFIETIYIFTKLLIIFCNHKRGFL